MSKLAHHHPVSPAMSKAHDLLGKIVIFAAVIVGILVLASALTSHGSVTW